MAQADRNRHRLRNELFRYARYRVVRADNIDVQVVEARSRRANTGTLNVGHTIPTIVEAAIFITIVTVAPVTLVALILAAVAGAWLGAGVVARLPRRVVQIGMGVALVAAAVLFVLSNLEGSHFGLAGGVALGLSGTRLIVGIVVCFILGALMTIGIGMYAPCMILISLLGMNRSLRFRS